MTATICHLRHMTRCVLLITLASLANAQVSIKPTDFDRLIMPCYGAQQQQQQQFNGAFASAINGNANQLYGRQANQSMSSSSSSSYGQPDLPSVPTLTQSSARNSQYSGGGSPVPRAKSVDNFIALVNKIEVANPRLANNPDQLIRALLSRFRLDNYYYDTRSHTPIADQDRRNTDILPAILGASGGVSAGGASSSFFGGSSQGAYQVGVAAGSSELFGEQTLDQDEKCSMYFMLSHFIDKSSAGQSQPPTLGQLPVQQLSGPQMGQRPPSLQAAGAGYPAASANSVYSSGTSGPRYPGPSPSFGSPAMANMNGFGAGISNQQPQEFAGRNPYGVNSPAISGSQQYNSALGGSGANLRNPQQASMMGSGSSYMQVGAAPVRPPYVDVGGRASGSGSGSQQQQYNNERVAIESGVVTLANQDNAALVLNRVLLGLLAATTPAQSIRQLAAQIYPTQSLSQTPKLDEEIDPLFAVTLADLWAVSALPKSGKPFDFRLLGDNGHWNDSMCPTTFTLDRSSSIKFTTAELLGGLDGFNLGMFRRRLLAMRRQLKLSEMLRIYYSRSGFRPQFAEVGVCQRGAILGGQLDDLQRQAENYLRLYQLSLPTSDQQIALQINLLESFRETARQAALAYAPQDLCMESQQLGGGDSSLYPMNGQEQCEISRADVMLVMDSSVQANQQFMQMVAVKMAQRLGLSRDTNSFSIMTNQQDTTGYAGAYSFNSILRNSTNLAEIGCSLVYDSTSGYQGGQVTEPTRLMEMFERALVNLDSEYLTRQLVGTNSYTSSSRQQSSYVSTWFDSYGANSYQPNRGGPRNTGGAKVIIWFNYGPQTRPSQLANGPTNWQAPGQAPPSYSVGSYAGGDQEYKFFEAKKYLRENFRSAAILAVAPARDDVKSFVYDETRDIFTDIPAGNEGLSSLSNSEFYPTSASGAGASQDQAQLAGPADQLINKLLQRMCTIPALFQYPMCFRTPSDGVMSAGYISPGRKQYWMMSPKTFFASRSVRLVFKVDGGRLRVCFGRRPNPDETALRNQQQQYGQQQPSIIFQQQQQPQQLASTTPPPTPSSDDYYTGLEYGVCKDVAPGQEINFMISEPCYKKSISECEPFYFVLREMSQPGEGDPNYMCRDDGCKRFDQAKFVLLHTGVSCSSAWRSVRASWPLVLISLLATCVFTTTTATTTRPSTKSQTSTRTTKTTKTFIQTLALGLLTVYLTIVQSVHAQQQAGVYDFGQNRYGEKRGNFTPSEVLAIILIVMLNLAGLALAIGLCFYVTKRARKGHAPVAQDEY